MKTIINLLILTLFAFIYPSADRTHTITGKVMDENGEAIIAANVLISGTTKGALTDIHGAFTLEVDNPCVTLEISYMGYEKKVVRNACAGKPVEVRLAPETIKLEEVVVAYEQARIKKDNMSMSIPKRNKAAGYAPAMGIVQDAYQPHNTEDYDHIVENRFYEVNQTPLSTFSIDVDAASYSNLRRFIQNGQMPPADAVRIEEMVNYFDYEYPQPTDDRPFEVVTELAECPWNDQHQLLMVGLQGKKIPTEHLPPSNLVFLIDVSGSMQSMNKLPLLKSSLKMLVDQLRPEDRVAITVYAGAAGLVLPPTSGKDKQKIMEAIDRLEAGGSTAGAAGIKLAYQTARKYFQEEGNNRVILATDGDFNVGTSSDGELVGIIEKERESGVFLTVLGFGTGNYKDNKMQKLADKGNGNHYYIDNINEGKKVLVTEFGGTLFTIAKDVKIQIEFNPAKVQGYRLIGYENRLLDKEDFNDDKKDAGELGSGHRVTALYELIPAGMESSFLANVDKLKYQQNGKVNKRAASTDEILTIKLRYKQPDGHVSQKIEKAVTGRLLTLDETSDNFRFAAAVAEFGMLLRNSAFVQNATYRHAGSLAKGAVGKDANGYRMELVRMIETVGGLEEPLSSER